MPQPMPPPIRRNTPIPIDAAPNVVHPQPSRHVIHSLPPVISSALPLSESATFRSQPTHTFTPSHPHPSTLTLRRRTTPFPLGRRSELRSSLSASILISRARDSAAFGPGHMHLPPPSTQEINPISDIRSGSSAALLVAVPLPL
jgi:hypothetical protein